MGTVQRLLGKVEEAVEAERHQTALELARQAVAEDGEDLQARAYLGWTSFLVDDFEAARDELESIVAREGLSWFTPVAAGGPLTGLCRRLFFRPRRRRSPTHPLASPVASFLARAYFHLGQHRRSRRWLERAGRLDDGDADDLYYRGLLALVEAERPADGIRQAVAWIRKADPKDPDFLHRRLGQLRRRVEEEAGGR